MNKTITDIDDQGFTEAELKSIVEGLKEAIEIRDGRRNALSMSDLWSD